MATKLSRGIRRLKKGLKTFKLTSNPRAIRRAYNNGMEDIRVKARRNAPKKSGALSRSIQSKIIQKERARSGVILRGYVYSNKIYDKMQYSSVPGGGLTKTEANNLSRKWMGKSHRVRTGQNYSKKQGRRKWAWGKRQGNKYMRDNQDFKKVNKKIAEDIVVELRKQLSQALSGVR